MKTHNLLYTCLAALLTLILATPAAHADYTAQDGWNVAQHEVTEYLTARGATKLRFAIVDFHMNQTGNRYAVYSDVKYTDSALKNQRDYFVVMFDETDGGYQLYMMCIGTEVIFGEP